MSRYSVVMITGASSGIGRETALAFGRRGLHVAGLARREQRLKELSTEFNTFPGEFLPLQADVSDADDVQHAVQTAIARFGRIDVLIANAGVGHRGAVVESDWDDIQALLRTNIDGMLHSIRAVVPAMRIPGDGGHVVLISSVTHNMVAPYAALYAASKAFVSSTAGSLRMELEKDNIYVTDALVGRTATEFNENRLGKAGSGGGIPVMQPQQVADAVVHVVLDNPRKRVAMRWFDRFLMLGNILVPDVIGRRAMRQYR